MADWKGIVKGGWHPGKEGHGPSVTGKVKGLGKGLLGRGDNSSPESQEHVAAPISSLRDPSSFGPPPKRTGYGGNVAAAAAGSPSPAGSYTPASQYQTQSYSTAAPATSPVGQAYNPQPSHGAHETEEPVAEPKPYRVDTTGLSISHLPPPPVRRDGADGRSPPPPAAPPSHSAAKTKPPPSLPPRLPPRSGNSSPVHAPSPTSTGGSSQPGYLNQGAVSRLGAAGISVPGLGIGGGGAAPPLPLPPPARNSPTSTGSPSTTSSSGQINELQSRFSRLGNSYSSHPESTSPANTTTQAAQGATWAQKQAALRTASSFQKDPSSVSFADAKTAAGTANKFRQRHGDQVASGMQTANRLGQRFGTVAGAARPPPPGSDREQSPQAQVSGLLGKKKPVPPPPPKKKPELSVGGGPEPDPPPVPLASRPRFD
ncbi:Uu.00g060140.m01.CDS01 [Anthostomella pinea]|uniref:Uu.00g060140.m01.CDS01 n=1 Tax=Anthostomella pinea TaxID=933095 RepID=A0AAI8YMG4_9PEZI|nr:Uu.00g060140.m01.CDS01 [Anthostomella pinea]